MAASPAEKWRGILLSSRYRVQRKLGSGSMGTVYLAHDARLDRLLALKLLNVQRMGSEAVARLQEEFRAIASLHHPQIAKAYDFGYTEAEPTVVHPSGQLARVPFYTSEYIEGLPLPPGPPGPEGQASPREFLKPFFDLLDALHYLHAHQMLHLDIHAGNLIVAKDSKRGSVLIDFGLVVPVSGAESTRLLRLRSSFAPELVADETPAPPADLYSVGRLLLYRLTGSGEGEARLPREIPGLGPRLTLELERI